MMMMRMMMMMRVTMQHTVIVIEQLLNASLEVCMNEDTVVGACVEGRFVNASVSTMQYTSSHTHRPVIALS